MLSWLTVFSVICTAIRLNYTCLLSSKGLFQKSAALKLWNIIMTICTHLGWKNVGVYVLNILYKYIMSSFSLCNMYKCMYNKWFYYLFYFFLCLCFRVYLLIHWFVFQQLIIVFNIYRYIEMADDCYVIYNWLIIKYIFSHV